MKKYLLWFIAVIILLSGCMQTHRDEPDSIHSYYDGNPVLVSDVEEYVKIKIMVYGDEPDYEMTEKIELSEIDSADKCWDYIDYRQYSLIIQFRNFYLSMSKEEKEQDYFVSLEKINYYTQVYIEDEMPDEIDKIMNLNRYIIFENPEYSSNGVEIKNNLMDMAEDKGMPFEEYVEKYYLHVALELYLSRFIPTKFPEENYDGEIPIYPDIFLLTKEISDEKLHEIAQDLDEYYSFIEIVSVDFYEYLLEQAEIKITN